MAETVTPSVRGRQRFAAEAALLAGAATTAAITGFVFGLIGLTVGSAVGGSAPVLIVGIVAAGVVLDATRLVTGRPRPVTLGRQVPREWGRLLPLPVTSFLYGGRLGVGPLTILSTWMWWVALIGAALAGVWIAVAVSVWFAVGRVVINGIVGRRLARRPRSNLAAVRLFERRGWSGLTGLAAVLTVTAALVAGCGVLEPAARPVLGDSPPSHRGASGVISSEHVPEHMVELASPPPTSPAQLEDFVRTSPALTPISPSTATSTATSTVTPPSTGAYDGTPGGDEDPSVVQPVDAGGASSLADLAPSALSGMVVIDDPSVDRFLTIDEAAAIQPDPTEEIALLETRGYRGGWIRAFRSPAADVAVAAVYEFADSTEAEFYLEDGLITIGGYGGQFFDVAELPDIRGFQQDVTDDGETVRTLGGAFHRDNRWFLLYVVGSPETVTPDVLIPALRSWRNDLGL